jgi:hypothetical protein
LKRENERDERERGGCEGAKREYIKGNKGNKKEGGRHGKVMMRELLGGTGRRTWQVQLVGRDFFYYYYYSFIFLLFTCLFFFLFSFFFKRERE